jgi:phosphoribosylformimino-5-aminoimidazole carboxamide ribotide isomerase
MVIFPEIQISGARVVTRIGADMPPVVHDVDPLELLDLYVAEGAERIHVVDVDAANGLADTNADLVCEILKRADIPVQVAGGMRTVNQIDEWLERGAASVVLGTLAITDPMLVADVCARHPGAIIANITTRGGVVMTNGWKSATAFAAPDIAYDLQMAGVAGIIHTDLDRFVGDASASLAVTMELKANVVIPVYASGTVQELDDIARVRYLPNIQGAIVGHALVTGVFTLMQALEVASQAETNPEPELESSLAEHGLYAGTRIYLAAYSNSPAARWWNNDLRHALMEGNSYADVSIPQEDLLVDESVVGRRELQSYYESALDQADSVVVLLDGVENEAWTGFECGYARATGKYLLGIRSTSMGSNLSRVQDMCDEVVIIEPGLDRQTLLASIVKEVNSRLLSEQADGSGVEVPLIESAELLTTVA